MSASSLSPAERLRTALEMFEIGEKVMEQNLRRRHPDADEDRIRELLQQWLETRPGAEHGDACGRPRPVEKEP